MRKESKKNFVNLMLLISVIWIAYLTNISKFRTKTQEYTETRLISLMPKSKYGISCMTHANCLHMKLEIIQKSPVFYQAQVEIQRLTERTSLGQRKSQESRSVILIQAQRGKNKLRPSDHLIKIKAQSNHRLSLKNYNIVKAKKTQQWELSSNTNLIRINNDEKLKLPSPYPYMLASNEGLTQRQLDDMSKVKEENTRNKLENDTVLFLKICFVLLIGLFSKKVSMNGLNITLIIGLSLIPMARCITEFTYTTSTIPRMESAQDVAVDQNGDYVVLLLTALNPGSSGKIQKISSTGTFLWYYSTAGFDNNGDPSMIAVYVTSDNNYIFCETAFSTRQTNLVKVANSGTLMWKVWIIYGDAIAYYGSALISDTYAIAHFLTRNLIKFDLTTNTTSWSVQTSVTNPGSSSYGSGLTMLSNGTLAVLCSNTQTIINNTYIKMYNPSNGALLTAANFTGVFEDIKELSDGSLILSGRLLKAGCILTDPLGIMYNCPSHYYVAKIAANGTVVWTSSLVLSTGSNTLHARRISVLNQNYIATTGGSYTFIISVSDGIGVWSKNIDCVENYGMAATTTGGLILVGVTTCNNPYTNIVAVNPIYCPPGNAPSSLSVPYTCVPCGIGTYPLGITCTNCPAGTFLNVTGVNNCIPCPIGYYQSATGSTSCLPCDVGTYAASTSSPSCTQCAAGTFQSLTAQTSCVSCPIGFYQGLTGKTSCIICPSGTYQALTGKPSCTPCDIGTANSLTGLTTACPSCLAGTFASTTGLSSCSQCSPGYFASGSGTSTCSPCAKGTFQPLSGQTSCSICLAGTFTSSTAQLSCTPCAIGYYQNLPGSESCLACGLGFYQTQTSQTSCNQCPVGKYSSSAGSSSCSSCSTGWSVSVNQDKCLFKGMFNLQADFTSSNFNTKCFSASTLVKPFTSACRNAFVPICCNITHKLTTIDCNFGLEISTTDQLYNKYCLPCTFNTISACPDENTCWYDVTDNLHTDYSITCLETIAPYCGSKLLLNPNDTECLMFTNSCNSVIINSSYGDSWTKFRIIFSRKLPSTLPPCRSIFDISRTPALGAGTFTCNRSSDYIIDVDISLLPSPVTSYYLSNSVLKDVCGVPIPYSIAQNVIAPNVPEIVLINAAAMDKCKPFVVNSTIAKNYLYPILRQYWIVAYDNNNGIPENILSKLQGFASLNSSTISLSDYDLFIGKVLRITSFVSTPYGTTISSNTLTITVPYPTTGKNYCGVCQLDNREKCNFYNGICWQSVSDYNISSPLNTSFCLKFMANDCYKIWKSKGFSDPQCNDFKQYLNISAMGVKVALLSASYSSTGKAINLIFNDTIYTDDFVDCSSMFSANTTNWLPNAKSGKWISKTQLQVDYDPQKGIIRTLQLNGGSFRYDYIYAQEYSESTTIPVNLPVLDTTVAINGITTVSECDPIELFGVTTSSSLFRLLFKWEINYDSSLLNQTTIDEYNSFIQKYNEYNPLCVFILPSRFLVKGTIYKITLKAKSEGFNVDLASVSVNVTVVESTPEVRFGSKSQYALELDGFKNNSVPVEVKNKKCSNRVISTSTSGTSFEVTFQVVSGFSLNSITAKGDDEEKISSNINQAYSLYKTLIIGVSQGFRYLKYYNITAKIRDQITGNVNYDSLTVFITKPPLKSIIDISGSLIGLSQDVQIDGGNSIAQMQDSTSGDAINYYWKCNSASSLREGGSCSCPAIDDSDLSKQKLIIPSGRLSPMCKYGFSLTFRAAYGDFVRTARNDTEFITYAGQTLPTKGKIMKAPTSTSTKKDIYLTCELPQTTNVKESNINFKWDLVEIKDISANGSEQFSVKNTYIYNFLKNHLNLNVDPSIKKGDAGIPEDKLPANFTSTSSSRILGIDKSTLLPQYKYTFSASIDYPSSPTFVFVDVTTSQSPRQRQLMINPTTGVGFETIFRISMVLPSSTDIDGALYQVFRRNCPSTNNETTTLTQLMVMSNSYETVLAPGLKACNFQVEIIVRAYEFEDYAEISTVIVVNESPMPVLETLTQQLSGINNSNLITYGQKLNILSQISGVSIVESSKQGKDLVNSIIAELSKIDQINGGVLDTMDDQSKSTLLSTGSSIVSSLLLKQKVNVDRVLGSSMKSKLDNYLVSVQTTQYGTFIIPSVIASLSGIADIATAAQNAAEFFAAMAETIDRLEDIILSGMPPGSPPYNLTSPSIDLVIVKKYSADFNKNQSLTTAKGTSISLPGNLETQMLKSLVTKDNTSSNESTYETNENSTITVGFALRALRFNPLPSTKNNTKIDVSSLNYASSSIVAPDVVGQIYSDLSQSKLNDVVDFKTQKTDIMQVAFKPFELLKNAAERRINNSIGIGKLQNYDTAGFSVSSDEELGNFIDDSISVPLYYLPFNRTWTNANCTLLEQNPKEMLYKLYCNQVGTTEDDIKKRLLSLTVDVLTNVRAVIQAGNYRQLANVGSLVDLSQRSITAYSTIAVIIVLIIMAEIILHRIDKPALLKAKILTLYERFNHTEKVVIGGIFNEVYELYAEAKRMSLENVAKKRQGTISPSEPKSNVKQSSVRVLRDKKKTKTNGLNKLSMDEKESLRDLYDIYVQCSMLYTDEELEELMTKEIEYCPIINRLTQNNMDEELLKNPINCCILLKHEHPFVSAFGRPEITTPRPMKFLIIVCAILGELFVTGYFVNTTEDQGANISFSKGSGKYLTNSIIYSVSSAVLMVPLKIIICIFLTGKSLKEDMTREQIESAESSTKMLRNFGIILGTIWIAACFYGIIIYILNFPTIPLYTWLISFALSFFLETCVIAQAKILVKVAIGVVLIKLTRSKILFTILGLITSIIVDKILTML